MKKLTVMIKDETDKEFRARVGVVKGTRKGNLSDAIEEAIQLWLKKYPWDF